MYLLGQSSHVSAMINFNSDACFEKEETEKIMKLLDSVSEIISNTDTPQI